MAGKYGRLTKQASREGKDLFDLGMQKADSMKRSMSCSLTTSFPDLWLQRPTAPLPGSSTWDDPVAFPGLSDPGAHTHPVHRCC